MAVEVEAFGGGASEGGSEKPLLVCDEPHNTPLSL